MAGIVSLSHPNRPACGSATRERALQNPEGGCLLSAPHSICIHHPAEESLKANDAHDIPSVQPRAMERKAPKVFSCKGICPPQAALSIDVPWCSPTSASLSASHRADAFTQNYHELVWASSNKLRISQPPSWSGGKRRHSPSLRARLCI